MKPIFYATVLAPILFLAVPGCGKHKIVPPIPDVSACVPTSCPSYFGTTQTFTYDQSRKLTKRTYDFGYPGYSPFVQTIEPTKAIYSYTQGGNTLTVTDIFPGGTGSLYDGMPDGMVRITAQTNPTNGYNYSAIDTPYSFLYDSKKRLKQVIFQADINTSTVATTYMYQLWHTTLDITYDDNDNAINLKQTEIYRDGAYVVQAPSESHFEYHPIVTNVVDITYDQKPSPFSGLLKYWKFVQGDWGQATNTNWSAIITSLSPHNPLTITWSVQGGKPSTQSSKLSYNYTDKGYPSDSYTYSCN